MKCECSSNLFKPTDKGILGEPILDTIKCVECGKEYDVSYKYFNFEAPRYLGDMPDSLCMSD